jgi:4-amino-4-deoxy-L-arabinose transferase-like glycosyltransferase
VTVLVWLAIAAIFVVRAIGAFTIPLTGDEAYYWEWSRRLAFGYVDHPPAVAWTIAAFAPLGHNPGLVRLGFVLCGVIATLAIAGCAAELTGDPRAGAIGALAMALAPLTSVAFGSASPDGPYLMFWSLALWFAARAFRRDRVADWLLLGLAVGGVLLSRVLGFALPIGLIVYALAPSQRHSWRRGMPLMLATALAVYAPFLAWNAQHDWVTLSFALVHRHQEAHQFSIRRAMELLLTQAAAYSPGIFVAIVICALRPRNALLAWTALPQFAVVTLLAFFEKVEIHWIFGTFASLCAMLGVAFVQISHRAKIVWTTVAVVPAAVLLPAIFAFTFAPVPIYRIVSRETGAQLRNAGPFEIMTYQMVADDAARLAREQNAVVMTDGYGLSSVMDFDAGITPVVIGYDWQGRESRTWFPDTKRPARALFVDKEPLSTRPDIALHLQRACAHVRGGGVHRFSYGGVGRDYYYTWCEGLAPDGLAILRWEREG